MSIKPDNKPRITTSQALALVPDEVKAKDKVVLLGVRGYYANSMGGPGNDRGIYDDAIIVLSPSVTASFNANTDPSVTREGVAVLKTGVWRYKTGIHGLSKPPSRQYLALVQAAEVVVHRDGVGDDRGFFGINIHRGSRNSTSSLGCQTIYPEQWDAFLQTVRSEMHRYGMLDLPYVLVEGPVN